MSLVNILRDSKVVPRNSFDGYCSPNGQDPGIDDGASVGILVKNLLSHITRFDLLNAFDVMGPIQVIDVHVNETGFPLGSAVIKFEDTLHAFLAFEKFNGARLDGRRMKITLLDGKQEKMFYEAMHRSGKAATNSNFDMEFDFNNFTFSNGEHMK